MFFFSFFPRFPLLDSELGKVTTVKIIAQLWVREMGEREQRDWLCWWSLSMLNECGQLTTNFPEGEWTNVDLVMPRVVVTVSQSTVCVCVCVSLDMYSAVFHYNKKDICKVRDHDNPFQASMTFDSFFTYRICNWLSCRPFWTLREFKVIWH